MNEAGGGGGAGGLSGVLSRSSRVSRGGEPSGAAWAGRKYPLLFGWIFFFWRSWFFFAHSAERLVLENSSSLAVRLCLYATLAGVGRSRRGLGPLPVGDAESGVDPAAWLWGNL